MVVSLEKEVSVERGGCEFKKDVSVGEVGSLKEKWGEGEVSWKGGGD